METGDIRHENRLDRPLRGFTISALFGGGLLGYVMYDCTHYYLHHGQPKTEVPRNLKVVKTFIFNCG